MVFKNSFTYHNFDKLCDLSIHLLPHVTLWNIHWNIRDLPGRKEWGFMDVNDVSFGLEFLYNYFAGFYMIFVPWMVMYYTFILFFSWNRIISKGYNCLILHEINNGRYISKIYKKKGERYAKLMYIVQQLIYVHLFALVTLPGFFFKWYSTANLLLYVILAFYFGSTYYIDYFAKKYEITLETLDSIEEA